MKKALVVIDMQVMPFIWKNYGGKALYAEAALVANVKSLIEKARGVDAPVIYVMYTERGESYRAEGQPMWQVIPDIAPRETDALLVKYHADSFLETGLLARLQAAGIQDVVLCGVQTEFCVDTTCRSAFSHGLRAVLAADAHSTYDSETLSAEQIIAHHNQILAQFAQIQPACEVAMD